MNEQYATLPDPFLNTWLGEGHVKTLNLQSNFAKGTPNTQGTDI